MAASVAFVRDGLVQGSVAFVRDGLVQGSALPSASVSVSATASAVLVGIATSSQPIGVAVNPTLTQ